jgi:hypothetical protein
VGQNDEAELSAKQELLNRELNRRGMRLSWSDNKSSLLEATLSRGDRRLGQVIYNAWRNGAIYDAWSELFKYECWAKAFSEAGLDPAFYAQRQRSLDEPLPWGHIDAGVSTEFLKREYNLAIQGKITPDCRVTPCHHCGLERCTIICQEKQKKTGV